MLGWKGICAVAVLAVLVTGVATTACHAGQARINDEYKVLAPITHGNLTIFPVVSTRTYGTNYLTLDEGLRTGEVVVTEAGRIAPLIRRRRNIPVPSGDSVNRLVLVNNSNRPLLLLAGEIVTGGKQDRVIGKDRIVPANSDPVDLSVFCVEQGRWTERTDKFGGLSGHMAQPTIRREAMANKNQQGVWDKVAANNAHMASEVPAAGPETRSSTSFATVMADEKVRSRVEEVAKPVRDSYTSTIAKLRDQNAVGVVVAVNGQVIWADIFANSNLLEKYWPKLVRSYAAESLVASGRGKSVGVDAAERFLEELDGRRAVVETEPGVYRHTEISGDDYAVFELTTLLGKGEFEVHIAKLAETELMPVIGNRVR
jgi:hypothetical protein